MEKLVHECGIVALSIPGNKDIAQKAYFGLNGIQHRGQVSTGLAMSNDGVISNFKDYGLVTEVFDRQILSLLKGDMCLGHVSQDVHANVFNNNAQPFVVNYSGGSLATAFNGGIINRKQLKEKLEQGGSVFTSTSDSEILAYMIVQAQKHGAKTIVEAVKTVLKEMVGGYSFVVMTEDMLVGARDVRAIRPLAIGRQDGGYVIASESCAIDLMGGEFVRDVLPGEIVVVEGDQLISYPTIIEGTVERAGCIFEYIYFARPDSTLDEINVYLARERSGRILAKEHPVDADIVIGVPDSGTPAATGYAAESGIPYSASLIKNKYIGRTFVEPAEDKRDANVRIKLNPIKEIVEGKKVVLVDDSMVRGTTMKSLIASFRGIGATEVHLRISSPPVYNSCDFGVITPSDDSLIANVLPIDELAQNLGADSIGYLSIQGLIDSVNGKQQDFCTGCFNGEYPTFEEDF